MTTRFSGKSVFMCHATRHHVLEDGSVNVNSRGTSNYIYFHLFYFAVKRMDSQYNSFLTIHSLLLKFSGQLNVTACIRTDCYLI